MSIYTPKNFYIYAYFRANGTPYYIGKGKNKRAWNKHKGFIKTPKNKALIVIIEENLTEVGALALERFYIRWYGRKDNGTGILRNLTDGGDGLSGRVTSEYTKKKLSEANKGRTVSEHTKNKMRGKNNHFYGGLPETVKEKMRTPKVNYDREQRMYNKSCRPIIATNTKTDEEFLFRSINECARTLQIQNISKVLSGKQKHSKGYTFKYA